MLAIRMTMNSTNVRKGVAMSHPIPQESGRVLFAAVAVWGTVMASAYVEGVMEKFEPAALTAFAAMVSAYAWIAYRVDGELRAFAASLTARTLLIGIAALGAAWIVAALAHAGAL